MALSIDVKDQADLAFERSWFYEMYQINIKTSHEEWVSGVRSRTFDQLRQEYTNDHNSLLEMSWEERDQIWESVYEEDNYKMLADNYYRAYLVSCEEHGASSKPFPANAPTEPDFVQIQKGLPQVSRG